MSEYAFAAGEEGYYSNGYGRGRGRGRGWYDTTEVNGHDYHAQQTDHRYHPYASAKGKGGKGKGKGRGRGEYASVDKYVVGYDSMAGSRGGHAPDPRGEIDTDEEVYQRLLTYSPAKLGEIAEKMKTKPINGTTYPIDSDNVLLIRPFRETTNQDVRIVRVDELPRSVSFCIKHLFVHERAEEAARGNTVDMPRIILDMDCTDRLELAKIFPSPVDADGFLKKFRAECYDEGGFYKYTKTQPDAEYRKLYVTNPIAIVFYFPGSFAETSETFNPLADDDEED